MERCQAELKFFLKKSKEMSKIIAVLPAYNEEGRVGLAVRSLKETGAVNHIFVISDGSSDNTAEEARSSGAEVFEISKNLGKGRALREFFQHSNFFEKFKADDLLLFVDADTAQTAGEAVSLAGELLVKGKGFFSVAVFPPPRRKGGFGLVKNLASWFIERTTGRKLKAPLSGQRALFLSDLKKVLRAFDYGYGLEVAMNYLLIKNGLEPVEVKLEMSHRETGRNIKDFLHRGRQFIDVLRVVRDAYFGRL